MYILYTEQTAVRRMHVLLLRFQKATEIQYVLYLIIVETDAASRENSISRALDIVKRILSDVNVTIHIVVIISQSDLKPYALTSSKFENITILNLY